MRFPNTWHLRDNFGREWVITVHPPQQEPDVSERWRQQSALAGLVYFSFQSYGAADDRIARVLLEVYDELTGDNLARRVPYPTRDHERRLRGFDQRLRRGLEFAARAGQLRIERVPERPWPFPEGEPASVPPIPPVSSSTSAADEQRTFIAVELVDPDGRPLRGCRYRIVLPDGTSREGRFDATGTVRFDDLDPGTALLYLPDCDGAALSPGRVPNPTPKPQDSSATTLSLELHRPDGSPIPYERYVVDFPDGSTRTGRLTRSGTAMIAAPAAGRCKVTFPALDASAIRLQTETGDEVAQQ